MNLSINKILVMSLAAIAVGMTVWAVWKAGHDDAQESDLVSGNGRIEATEIDIATKFAGRVVEVYVREGDFVEAGQVVAQMQSDVLEAQLREALAQLQEAMQAVASAEAQTAVRESNVAAAQAVVIQRESELDNAKRRLARTRALVSKGSSTQQKLDDDEAAERTAEAALKAANAQVTASQAAVKAAKAQVTGAGSRVEAVQASVVRVEADLADSQLRAPRDGRVQYRVAEPGEVIGAGGTVLNMVDLSDVYMTFFLPETVVGRVALDSEARIVLDALPGYVIPARVSYVSSVAQFTPKTVETEVERQKLMFRVKARIEPALLEKHTKQVKTGLPGVAWLKLESQTEWPQKLTVMVPE
ncbi:MAG: hemolysin D [Gammaproteobacteria bacterium]|nr:MAG: hemolysin D [Gammaproteobacteria bacterium]